MSPEATVSSTANWTVPAREGVAVPLGVLTVSHCGVEVGVAVQLIDPPIAAMRKDPVDLGGAPPAGMVNLVPEADSRMEGLRGITRVTGVGSEPAEEFTVTVVR